MVFSSAIFLYVYLPVVLGIYFVLPARARNLLLLISSIFFYTWGEGVLVGVMLGSAAVDYLAARVIDAGFPAAVRSGAIPMGPDRTRRQRAALAGSVVVNLTLLGVFKYFNFALDNCNAALVALGLSDLVWVGIPAVVLPLGISFYTFQSMSYTIDVYRGHVRPARRFIDFACFVTMFPQLVAGFNPLFGIGRENCQSLSRGDTEQFHCRPGFGSKSDRELFNGRIRNGRCFGKRIRQMFQFGSVRRTILSQRQTQGSLCIDQQFSRLLHIHNTSNSKLVDNGQCLHRCGYIQTRQREVFEPFCRLLG